MREEGSIINAYDAYVPCLREINLGDYSVLD